MSKPKCLILVPTDSERRGLAPRLAGMSGADVPIELCGFGIAAAAARTARLIATLDPARVLLVGIAGRFHQRLAIGSAWLFDRVACHGIGAGSGTRFVPAGSLGWPQWPGDPAVGDELPCSTGLAAHLPRAGLLLTACAASAGQADVAARMRTVPDAVAEDMEGFGVALACRLAGVPLDIVRGISNDAGDRNTSSWRTTEALRSAADVAAGLVAEDA